MENVCREHAIIALLVPKIKLGATFYQETDDLQHVHNVINDRHHHAWSRLTWHGSQASVSKRPSARWHEFQRGRILRGWQLHCSSHQRCPGLRQVFPASRTLRVKIAASPLCRVLVHSSPLEPSPGAAGAVRTTDPIWTVPHVTCPIRHQELLRTPACLPSCASGPRG